MSTINDSDLLLVERNGNLHQITYDQMSTLNDDDILLVERGGVQYKVEAQYVSTGANGLIIPPVEVLTPINGAGITEFDQYEPLSSAITAVGGAGTFDKSTDEIQGIADEIFSGQVWSNDLQSSSDWLYQPTSAFDGIGNEGAPYTYAQVSVTGSSITFTPSTPIPYSESISIYMASAGGTASVNGAATVAVANSSDSVIASGSGTLTSLVLNASNSTTLMYIKVDGKFLIDAVEDSQVWSSGGQTTGLQSGYGWDVVFDNDLSVGSSAWLAVAGGTMTWVSPAPLTGEVEMWIPANKTGKQTFSLNGGAGVTGTASSYVSLGTLSNEVATITSTGVGSNGAEFFEIKVGGKLLVDAGVRTPPDPIASGNKILSVPTNTNFSGLSVGDVVQGNPLNGTASVTQGYTFTDGRGDLDKLFDGVVTGNGTASSDYLNHLVQPNDAGGLPCTLTFDPPLSARSGTLKAYVTRYSAGNVNYTINGSVGHSVYAASSPVEDDTGVTSISTFTFDSNTGNAQLWGFADGEGVLQHVDNVTVTAIDASAPSQQQADVYATWDPSKNPGNNTLSNGNLTITTPSSGISATGGTIAVSSGKWYYEFEVTNGGSTAVGFIKTSDSLSGFLGGTSGAYSYYSESGYVKKINNNARTDYGEYYGTGDTIGVALDLDAGTITFYKNGVSQGQAFSGLSGTFIPAVGDGTSQSGITGTANFGQNAWTHEPPTGFVGLSETVTTYTYPNITVSGGTWDASNQSQVWSTVASVTTGTAYSGRGLDRLFNGIVNNDDPPADAFFESDGNPMTVTFSSPITATSSIKMWIAAYYAQTTGQLYVNGNNFDVSNVPSNNNDPILVDLGVTSLTSFGTRSNQTIRFSGIVVDGQLLVDAFEDSQVWSNGTYTGTAANNNYGVTDLFANVGNEGDAFGANKLWGLYQATATFTLDNPIPLTSNSTLELITYQSSSSSGSITLTGSAGSLVPTLTVNGTNVLGKTTVNSPYASLGDSITSITIAASGADWTGIEGIIIDGKHVIDAGIRDLGDRKVSVSIPYEKSLTFSDTTELANMVGPLEMTDANGDVVTPVSDTIASVSGNTLTLASDTNLAYFQPGDEVQTGVQVVSVDEAAPSITVDGGEWLGADGTNTANLISRSLRFNSADSDDLRRSFPSAGNTKTFTLSFWAKRSKLGSANQRIFACYPPQEYIRFDSNDTLRIFETFATLQTTQVFRDCSKWYHFVISVDSTQTTASDRIKFYVDGTQVTDFTTQTYPSLNADCRFNTAVPHQIGSGTVEYFDGYLADVHFIDGQQFAPTEFGEFDANNGWQPKSFSGTYGTNGFHLDFSDNSSNAALGTDSSGNSNTWTVNNFVAASKNYASYVYAGGATYSATETGKAFYTGDGDDLFDGGVSTYVGGENVVGGTIYFRPATAITGVTSIELYGAYNGETRVNGSVVTVSPSWSTSDQYVSIQSPPSTITEISVKGNTGYSAAARIKAIKVNGSMLVDSPAKDVDSLVDVPANHGTDTGLGGEVRGSYATMNPLDENGSTSLSNGNLDMGNSQGGSAWGTNRATIGAISGKYYAEYTCNTSSGGFRQVIGVVSLEVANTGGAAPSNVSLNNLSDSAAYFNNGQKSLNGSTSNYGDAWTVGDVIGIALDVDNTTVTFYKNGVSQGVASSALASDAALTFGGGTISSNETGSWNFGQLPFAYATPSGYKALCDTNLPEATIKEGSNHFDAVTFTGSSSGGSFTIPNFEPDLIWCKNRDGSKNHILQDSVRGFGDYKSIYSNLTLGNLSGNNGGTGNIMSVSGSTVNYGTNDNFTGNMVAWAWNAGDTTETIAAGSLNSSVYDQSQTWSTTNYNSNSDVNPSYPVTRVFDGDITQAGGSYAGVSFPNSGGYIQCDFTEFGSATSVEVILSTYGTGWSLEVNGSSVSGVPTSNIPNTSVTVSVSGFTSIKWTTVDGNNFIGVAGIKVDGKLLVDSGVSVPSVPSIGAEVRANPDAGFSVVKYTGNDTTGAVTQTVPHGLNAAPEMYIIKSQVSGSWYVYHKELGNTKYLSLNGTAAEATSILWNNTSPTSSVFSVRGGAANTNNQDFIAYCFNSLEGYSSIGSYIGNGSADGPFVYTGFKPAFVMVRSTSDQRQWVMLDNARFPENGPNMPTVYANSSGAETINSENYADFLSNGFKVRAANGNWNGGGNQKYIYLAFASNPFAQDAQIVTSGDTQVSLDPLAAIATDILEIDGTTMYLNGATGPWRTGLSIEGSQINDAPPGPSEVTFTSQNQGTPVFSSVDATLASRTWTLESSTTSTGPWTLVDTYSDFGVLNTQTGATPWTENKPTLQPNTYYRIKVQYNSTNADSVESVYNTFKTGDA